MISIKVDCGPVSSDVAQTARILWKRYLFRQRWLTMSPSTVRAAFISRTEPK